MAALREFGWRGLLHRNLRTFLRLRETHSVVAGGEARVDGRGLSREELGR